MTTLADTAGDVLRRIYDPKPPMSPDQYLDRVAVFVHPDTENDFFDAGRVEHHRQSIRDGGENPITEIVFPNTDPQYPGKRVCIDDTLEPGKVYTRVSPPDIKDEVFRLVDSTGPDGRRAVTVHCDKVGETYHFDASVPRETMLNMFRKVYARKHTRFLVYVQPGVMTVQTYD